MKSEYKIGIHVVYKEGLIGVLKAVTIHFILKSYASKQPSQVKHNA